MITSLLVTPWNFLKDTWLRTTILVSCVCECWFRLFSITKTHFQVNLTCRFVEHCTEKARQKNQFSGVCQNTKQQDSTQMNRLGF